MAVEMVTVVLLRVVRRMARWRTGLIWPWMGKATNKK